MDAEEIKETMLEMIMNNEDINDLGINNDMSISTSKSNTDMIKDVIEVRKQVEKFRDLLENSKNITVQFQV